MKCTNSEGDLFSRRGDVPDYVKGVKEIEDMITDACDQEEEGEAFRDIPCNESNDDCAGKDVPDYDIL